ncbi:Unclassified short-chain dehydrogenase/reductase SDR [Desulfatibacillum aliphaticivorans]|uniref:Unclassified short-chain dehydrogenase/reductase SDR n=1 Tax=Desulfatibacillum aliphaticivorans TaxID=218208 RepID=B8FMQ0_DESAL|nr:SDR family oxidoreductase [Desulfatibacillum aliphaticivorans]ACL01917.1 Unclassified short-chain dehydrogenase/reductase SDR [Desulfatibacillum aliphaticivorans]
MRKFPGKRVIITGAGSGFGRALALEFAKENWKIGVADINEERADETVDLVAQKGGQGLKILCDVTDAAQLENAAALLEKEWGGVDVVVNNAGVGAAGFMEKIPMDKWDWIIGLNLKSVIHGCRAFIPLMEKQGKGHIINMASNAGIACLPEMASYNVTKAAVIALSETLRSELSTKNIGVTVVCPTFFKTNLMDQFNSTDDRQRDMAEKFFSTSRTTAEKVAKAAMKALKKNKLYVVTPWDGKLVWTLKRLCPEIWYKLVSMGYHRFDKSVGESS